MTDDIASRIDRLRSPNGGWSKEALVELGVPWPPPKGWRKALIAGEPIPEYAAAPKKPRPRRLAVAPPPASPHMVIGNSESMLVHTVDCSYAWLIGHDRFIEFDSLHDAISVGYQEAGCCLTDNPSIDRISHYERLKEIRETVFAPDGCVVCGEIRGIQRAHVVPQFIGTDSMVIPLCPTHHWSYDHGTLTNGELRRLGEYAEEKRGKHGIGKVYKYHGAVARHMRGQ